MSGINAQEATTALEKTNSSKSQREENSALDEIAKGERGFSEQDGIYEDTPTPEELATLRRVSDKFPYTAWLVAIVEFAERFSYYGTIAAYSNYIRQGLPPGSTTGAVPVEDRDTGIAGALGQGQTTAFALTTFNSFWMYVTPILGAVIADSWLGRYKTIWWASGVCLIGHVILTCTSIPQALENPDGALAGCAVSIVIIGLGGGCIKSNVSPLIAEQYKGRIRKRVEKNGETVIVDPGKTYERLFLMFYWMINIGALSQIAASFLARDVGFWMTYALPTWVFLLVPAVLWLGRKRYVLTPPRGSILLETLRVVRMACSGKWSISPVKTYQNFKKPGFWDIAKPSYYSGNESGTHKPASITWDDEFVLEVRRALKACQVFLYFPFYWLCYVQINNNLITTSAGMRLDGTPNDLVSNLNPIFLVVSIPIFDRILYPLLRKMKINFTPIKRITAGFFVAACGMAYSAGIQQWIYNRSPCGSYASSCVHEDGTPNASDINVWVLGPSFILIALSEILASTTGLEYAFSKAPARMKSVITSLFLFTNAAASALNFALTEVAKDPTFVWLYGAVAVAATIFGILFYLNFRGLDKEDDELNQIGTGQRDGFVDEKDSITTGTTLNNNNAK